MFSSSMRRVATTPATSLPAATRPSSAIIIASSNGSLTGASRSHQRRYSSSKPPVPPSDGSRGIDASSQSGPTKGVNPANKEGSEKREGKASKRRTKGNAENGSLKSKPESSLNLPSVPSTQYLHPHDIHVASFFSIHRPMSVTTSVPSNANPEAFNSIFSQKKQSKSRQNDDVIYTLSSAVNAIESGLPKNHTHSSEGNDLRAAVTQASNSNAESDVTHLDGVPMQDLRVSIQEFAKRLRPFNPPPAPVPMDEAETPEIAETEGYESESAGPRERSYSTVVTLRESTDSDGHKTYEAHATPFVSVDNMEAPPAYEGGEGMQDPSSHARFLDRMRIRQLRWEEFRDRRRYDRMQAISVKRQRKLKIKKHKHRKLLKKTRHLRRKLDKA